MTQFNTLQQCASFGSPQLTVSLKRDIFVAFLHGLHIDWLVKGLFGVFFLTKDPVCSLESFSVIYQFD